VSPCIHFATTTTASYKQPCLKTTRPAEVKFFFAQTAAVAACWRLQCALIPLVDKRVNASMAGKTV